MEVIPAEEVFELNSNSTANTLKEQRLERNKELRLKAYLVARCPVKNQQKDCISESSSEFPASSPSNPQMQRKSHYQTRPPLLKNTLPADAFERGLALIATKTPQMTMNEKIESWNCNAEELSDVEDVVNFDAMFEQHEEDKIKMLSKNNYEHKHKLSTRSSNDLDQLVNNTCYSFAEFQRRLLAIDPRKTYFQCNEQKHNSKLTSEEDEKPTTSNNCLLRNRDTPLKKRACKYKRAAEPIAHLPNKKSSSSDTPRDGASSPKKKLQQQKLSTANVGSKNIINEKMQCRSSSDVSSQHANLGTTNVRQLQTQQSQAKSKPIKIIEPTPINNNKWNSATISSNNTARNEEESFFRWRRLSREIDKAGISSIDADITAYQRRHINSSPPRAKQDLIQIRYDFIDTKNVSSNDEIPQSNAYNVVIKSLKKEESDWSNNVSPNLTSAVQDDSKQLFEGSIGKTEALDVNFEQDVGAEFHQQHEFCNYLGLTGMSTANAMANAAAELLKCNLARRSLRVRNLEQLKAKTKQQSPSEKARGKNINEIHEIKQEVRDNLRLAETTLRNSNTSERSETNANYKLNPALSSTASYVDETKENEAKIKILCQISSIDDIKQEEISNESVKSFYKPIRFTPCFQMHNASKQENSEQIESTLSDTKYIDLRPKTPSDRNSIIQEEPKEVHELHEKVQKYLKESRKAVPHIFIVQSLESTSANEKPKEQQNNVDPLDIENNQRSKLSILLQNNKSTEVNKTEKKKQRKSKTLKKTTTSNMNRRLCTRSMLNLNQQRELRNRKVILKLLKSCSDLKIKMRNTKNQQIDGVQTKEKKQNDCNENNDEQSVPLKKISELAETTIITENSKEQLGTSFPLNIKDEKTTEHDDSHKKEAKSSVFIKQHDHLYTNKTDELEDINETRTPQIEISITSIDDDDLKHKTCNPSNVFFQSENNLKTIDAAVQTDPEAIIEQLPVFIELTECKTEESIHLVSKINNTDMDVSSSDMVTSTTNGVGDQNRFETKNSPNLVIKKTAPQEKQPVTATDATSQTTQLATDLIANPNISINTSNINELGIHALREPSKPLRNPLQEAAGSVLHIYYESDILIVVQESLISFWKYIRVLNALLGKPSKMQKTEELHEKHKRDVFTTALEHTETRMDLHASAIHDMSSSRLDECEWIFLGEKNRLNRDIQIGAPFMNRMCLSESRPVYLEMFCRELFNEFRECNLLSCYVNVYFFNEEDQLAICHSIQLDSVQSLPSDVMYTAINESRYFVLAWPQANVLGKFRSGLCKYALTPELDMLATTRDFKAMRHNLRSLECLNDGKLVGFGDTQLTVWDHRSGDVLMNYDLEIPIGRNLGTIYYPSFESGQNNVLVMIQQVEESESTFELVIIACSISHLNPSRRILFRHSLSNPKKIQNISSAVNNGEHLIIQTGTGDEILISCNDPRQLMFVPAQSSKRFYTRGRAQIIELTNVTLTIDSFSSYLLKIAAGFNTQKSIEENQQKSIHKIWCA